VAVNAHSLPTRGFCPGGSLVGRRFYNVTPRHFQVKNLKNRGRSTTSSSNHSSRLRPHPLLAPNSIFWIRCCLDTQRCKFYVHVSFRLCSQVFLFRSYIIELYGICTRSGWIDWKYRRYIADIDISVSVSYQHFRYRWFFRYIDIVSMTSEISVIFRYFIILFSTF